MTQPGDGRVDDDAATLAHLEAELVKRYGSDYDVVAVGSSEATLGVLDHLRDSGRPLALLLADLLLIHEHLARAERSLATHV